MLARDHWCPNLQRHDEVQVCAAFQNSGILPLIFLNAMFRGSPELLTRGVAYVRCVMRLFAESVAVRCVMPTRCCWNAGALLLLLLCCVAFGSGGGGDGGGVHSGGSWLDKRNRFSSRVVVVDSVVRQLLLLWANRSPLLGTHFSTPTTSSCFLSLPPPPPDFPRTATRPLYYII